jgi:hypothetical protein
MDCTHIEQKDGPFPKCGLYDKLLTKEGKRFKRLWCCTLTNMDKKYCEIAGTKTVNGPITVTSKQPDRQSVSTGG